jgi:hypothetical protein
MRVPRKILLIFFVVVALTALFQIGNVVMNDFDELTLFGLGYLTVLAILFLFSISVTVVLAFRFSGKNNNRA